MDQCLLSRRKGSDRFGLVGFSGLVEFGLGTSGIM